MMRRMHILFSSVQAAYDAAMRKYGPKASVWAIPYGGSILPWYEN